MVAINKCDSIRFAVLRSRPLEDFEPEPKRARGDTDSADQDRPTKPAISKYLLIFQIICHVIKNAFCRTPVQKKPPPARPPVRDLEPDDEGASLFFILWM